MAFGIKAGGIFAKIFAGTLLGIGLTTGYILTNWAANQIGGLASGARYGFQGNVLPYEQNQYSYDSNNPAMYGPSDEQRFVG